MFNPQVFLQTVPQKPGVYQMIGLNGIVLYVGKAKDLKKRVSSYFNRALETRISNMVSQIEEIELTITASEKEALLLETSLIKHLVPKYNVIFKDDKSYPYLVISKNKQFPRLFYHRSKKKQSGVFFGPYPSAQAVKSTLTLIQKLFKLRSCDDTFFLNRSRPCLQYQIKRCKAPCVGYVSQDEYIEDVKYTRLFLENKQQTILNQLIDQMHEASKALNYESAGRIRDQIQNIQAIVEQQAVYGEQGDADAIAIHKELKQSCVYMLHVRNGQLMGSNQFFPKTYDESFSEIMLAFVQQHYLQADVQRNIPKELILSHDFEDRELIEGLLKQRSGKTVKLLHNVRGQRRRWLEMASDNALEAVKRRSSDRDVYQKRRAELSKALGLKENFEQMVCFDVSHTMGEETVASCVVFDQQGPMKTAYRRYLLNIDNGDDYAAMTEVLTRYCRKLKEDNVRVPDIMWIDGGKGQVAKAQEVVKEAQIEGLMIIGIAKGKARKAGLEQLFLSACEHTSLERIDMPPNSSALNLIQHIRDEAHRFAITLHRKRRGEKRLKSPLDGIPGIGPKRKTQLLSHFGGLKGLTSASIEAIAKVKGISPELAGIIHSTLHDN